MNERGHDADLRRHAVEAINPDVGAAELLIDFPCEKVEETPFISKMHTQIVVVRFI